MSMKDCDLTDNELKSRLKEVGIDPGPINDSTRHLYVKQWRKKESEFRMPPKKPNLKKQTSRNNPIDRHSPPKSPPIIPIAKKPHSLKRSASDTRQEDSATSSKRSTKKLKRCDSGTSSVPDEFRFSNGVCHDPPPKRTSERTNRGRPFQGSQDSDVSTSSTIGSDGSQPLVIDGISLIDKSSRLLPSIPEEVCTPINGLSMDSGLFNVSSSGAPSSFASPSSFVLPRINGYKHSPAGSSKPLILKSFNGQSSLRPSNHLAAASNSSFGYSLAASRPLLHDPKQWLGWSGGERKQDWELNPDSLTICKTPDGKDWRLGMGGYCEVYRGLMHEVDDVAVKICKISTKDSLDPFKREIDLISKLHHRNILQFYGACLIPNNVFMITELMEIDLFNGLKSDNKMQWNGEYGWSIARDIALGMNYLHKRDPTVVHRDLKSSNVMLHRYVAKIGDVGIARFMTQENMTAQNSYTLAWAAPEVVYRHRATEKIDIWSFGIILWEIVTGKIPKTGYLSMPYWCPENVKSIYVRCILDDPNLRPTAADIVKSLDEIQGNK